jgi:hypothetical protein
MSADEFGYATQLLAELQLGRHLREEKRAEDAAARRLNE